MAAWLKARGAALLAAAAAAVAPGMTSASDRVKTVRVGDTVRSYAIHVPDGPAPRGGFPVILAFHGGGMQGAGMQRITRLDAVADRQRFITIYPDGIGKHWNDGRATIRNPQDDVGFVSAMLDQVMQQHKIASGRVFATGISNGALFAQRLGCDLSQRIAGIAAVAGTMPADLAAACRAARPIAVMQIGSTADPIMPYGGGTVKDFGGRGEGGVVTSVADTATFWAGHNGCGVAGRGEPLPVTAPLDPTRVVRVRYVRCPAAAPVTVLTVAGGGHVWPGGAQPPRPAIIGRASRQIDTSAVIAAFFLSLPAR